MKFKIIRKIILTSMFFAVLMIKKTYAITAAQAAKQQQIVAEIEEVLLKKVDKSNYDGWIKSIEHLINTYQKVNLSQVQQKIKTLETILSLQAKPESLEEKINETHEIQNNEIVQHEEINQNKTSNISPEEEKKILSYLEDLLKQNITEIDEITNEETLEYKKWKFTVEASIKSNIGKSKLIDAKLTELQEKLNKVIVIRNFQEVVDKIKIQLNSYHDSIIQPGNEKQYIDWKKKTEAALTFFDDNQKLAQKYNIIISKEDEILSQKLLDLYNQVELTVKKN